MANKTIHELSPATTVGSGYEFAIYDTDNNTTKKATVSDILSTQDLLYADDEATPTGEVDFSSQDTSLSPSSSVSVDLLSGDDSWSARFVKISQMFKNIRFLLGKLGTTDISTIGDSTVTGAISALNSKLSPIIKYKTFSASYNVSAGTYISISSNTFNKEIPSGYRALAVKRFSSGNNQVAVTGLFPDNTGDSTVMTLRNLNATTQMSGSAAIGIVFIRTDVSEEWT